MARRNAKRRGKTEAPQVKKEEGIKPSFLIDVAALALMGFSIFAFLSFMLFESHGLESSKWLGSFGVVLGAFLERWLGVGSFALVLWGAVLSLSLLREGSFAKVKLRSFLSLPFVLVSLAAFLSITVDPYTGGLLGVRVGVPLSRALGVAGGAITAAATLVVSLALSSGMGVKEFVGSSAKTSAHVGATGSNILWKIFVVTLRSVLELIGLLAWIVKSIFTFGRRSSATTEAVWDKDLEESLPKPRRRKNTVPSQEEEKEEIEDIPTHVVVKRRVNAVQAPEKKKKAGK